MKNYRSGGTEGRPVPKDEWRTPLELFQRLTAEFNFQLDAACSTSNCLCTFGMCSDLFEDSLSEDWDDLCLGGSVWLNPPYSNVRPWLEKAFKTKATVVCLITADTSTRWWQETVVGKASEVRFLIGRVKFLDPDAHVHSTKRSGGGTTTPGAIVVYGESTTTQYSYIPARIKLSGK